MSKNVAIIGGGPSGLVTARQCSEEGHRVTVFEESNRTGGIWVIDNLSPQLQTLHILDKTARRMAADVQGSMYESLTTNIPREVMGFSDYPFDTQFPESEDSRRFCGHQEVLRFIHSFAREFDLNRFVKFNSTVTKVSLTDRPEASWDVEVETVDGKTVHTFDAVIVANGHFSKPHIPEIPDLEKFGKPCLHSHLYRNSEPFAGKTVAILGNLASGVDIAVDIGEVAKTIYLCARSWEADTDFVQPRGPKQNIIRARSIKECKGIGRLKLIDGTELSGIDILIFCTGYDYSFQFLQSSKLISTETHRVVYPLYRHLFHAKHPTLAFVGIPLHTITFLVAEYQARYVAKVFSGKCKLPETLTMLQEIDASIDSFKTEHGSLERFHWMPLSQHEYMNNLAEECGDVAPVGNWRRQMHDFVWAARMRNMEGYRDHPIEHESFEQALEEFKRVRAHVADKITSP